LDNKLKKKEREKDGKKDRKRKKERKKCTFYAQNHDFSLRVVSSGM
jgi:hypothetical protein